MRAGAEALWSRDTEARLDITATGDRRVQYLRDSVVRNDSEAGIEPSVGTSGTPTTMPNGESVIGLFKTEVIRREGPWRPVLTRSTRHSTGCPGTTSTAFSNRSDTFLRRVRAGVLLQRSNSSHRGRIGQCPRRGKVREGRSLEELEPAAALVGDGAHRHRTTLER